MTDSASWLLGAALGFFWVAALGLLWRRSLVGMLMGLMFGWLSVGVLTLSWEALLPARSPTAWTEAELVATRSAGSVFVVIAATLGLLQVLVGLSIVVARIKRRGSLDADDAGLLEG